jgi:hypothetical protein
MHLYYWPEAITWSDFENVATLDINSVRSGRSLYAPRSYVDENEFTLLVPHL